MNDWVKETEVLIKNGKVDEAFSFVEKFVKQEQDLHDKFILLQSRYSDLVNQLLTGTIDNSSASAQRNQILQSFLDFLKSVKALLPTQVKIFFYVVVSTKNKIEQHLGKDLFDLFEPNRYPDNDKWQWMPFWGQGCIRDLLKMPKQQYGFEPILLDGDDEIDDFWEMIDDHIEHSIAIIDLFSLYGSNQDIAKKFDTQKAGVVLPVCNRLDNKLKDTAEQYRHYFKTLTAKTNRYISCDFFASDVSTLYSFNQNLIRILKNKFPIKNQSSYDTPVRRINIGF